MIHAGTTQAIVESSPVSNGVPHGVYSWSITIYIILYINYIILPNRFFNVSFYADDTTLYVPSFTPTHFHLQPAFDAFQ